MTGSKVLVVNPILYHYRRGVFRALDRSPDLEFTFAADPVGRDGILAMSPTDITRFVGIHARRWRKVEWHSGLIWHLLFTRYSHVIFLGDASVLTTWIASVLCRIRRTRVFFWTIGWHRPESGAKRLARLAFYRMAHALLLYGNIGKEIGVELGYPAAQMHVIGNSFERATHIADRADLSLPPREEGVSWIGAVIRLSSSKQLGLILRASAILRQAGRDVRVLIVGDGPEQRRLEQMAAELEVPLHLPGAAYSSSDLASVYEVLDVTVVPTAIGLTAVQSLSFGVPAISNDSRYEQMPEWEAIVVGVTGDTFKAGDPRALADALERVFERLRSDQGSTAAACRLEVANHWSAEAHADRILEAISGYVR